MKCVCCMVLYKDSSYKVDSNALFQFGSLHLDEITCRYWLGSFGSSFVVLGPYNPTASKTFAVMLGFCTSFVAAGSLFQGSLKHFVDNIVNIFGFALNHLSNDMVVSKDYFLRGASTWHHILLLLLNSGPTKSQLDKLLLEHTLFSDPQP